MKQKKKIDKLDLARYMGYVRTQISIDQNNTPHVLYQRIEDKLNEVIERLNNG